MRRSASRAAAGLIAMLMSLAAGASDPAVADTGCVHLATPAVAAGLAPAKHWAEGTRLCRGGRFHVCEKGVWRADQPCPATQTQMAAHSAECDRMVKADRLALALLGMCHYFAAPSDRLCADYVSACQRLRAAGCSVDWACY